MCLRQAIAEAIAIYECTPLETNFDEFSACPDAEAVFGLDQFILPCIFADEVCSALKIKRGSAGMVVNTIGQGIGQEAITFQSLWAPAAECFLEVSATCRFRKLDSGVSMV
jgi:hypothetical protein